MISILLGQIIQIFDKENSPPRGSSRGIKAYEASYFLGGWLALVWAVNLLSGDGERNTRVLSRLDGDRVVTVVLDDTNDTFLEGTSHCQFKEDMSRRLQGVLLVLELVPQGADAPKEPPNENNERVRCDITVSKSRRRQGGNGDDDRREELWRGKPRPEFLVKHGSLLSWEKLSSKLKGTSCP